MADSDGHCTHCAERCPAAYYRHRNDDGDEWDTGMCPWCAVAAVREQIISDIHKATPRDFPGITQQWVMELVVESYEHCAEIANGET